MAAFGRINASALCLATILILLESDPVAAQCPLDAKAQAGATGYRQRGYACEGMYVQLQSAPLNVQVISLVRGSLSYDRNTDSLRIHVPEKNALDAYRDSIAIVGRAREANLNWALDGFARPDSPMVWILGPVIHEIQLAGNRLGLFGETRKSSGLGGPVYVPLEVGSGGTGTAQQNVELVIRIPAAGAVRWRSHGDGEWDSAKAQGGDGYFVIPLPPASPGEEVIEVQWSPRGKRQFDAAPERIRILRW